MEKKQDLNSLPCGCHCRSRAQHLAKIKVERARAYINAMADVARAEEVNPCLIAATVSAILERKEVEELFLTDTPSSNGDRLKSLDGVGV